MINLPIYRAKKIDSDEYVVGWYSSPIIIEGKTYLSITNKDGEYRIDTTTLSIHFSDMLDSQGNEIFASLQKNGRGGDVCSVNDYIDSGLEGVAIYQNYGFRIDRKGKAMGISLSSTDIKIIGIQQWNQMQYKKNF